MVTCDARDKNLTNHKKYPCLIVEVLSDSTEAFDRGDKFANSNYRPGKSMRSLARNASESNVSAAMLMDFGYYKATIRAVKFI